MGKLFKGPETMEHLGLCAYTAYAKEIERVNGPGARPWTSLPWEQMRGWQHAANNVVVRVAAFGYPRPLIAADEAREAGRCAEWLLHVADGGDAGSDVQLGMLLRTAARMLQQQFDVPGAPQ